MRSSFILLLLLLLISCNSGSSGSSSSNVSSSQIVDQKLAQDFVKASSHELPESLKIGNDDLKEWVGTSVISRLRLDIPLEFLRNPDWTFLERLKEFH